MSLHGPSSVMYAVYLVLDAGSNKTRCQWNIDDMTHHCIAASAHHHRYLNPESRAHSTNMRCLQRTCWAQPDTPYWVEIRPSSGVVDQRP